MTGLYSGCTALILGNSVKAGVRFVSYDQFKHMLADPQVSFMINATENNDTDAHMFAGTRVK